VRGRRRSEKIARLGADDLYASRLPDKRYTTATAGMAYKPDETA
jgi:hypothetical protein